MQICDLLESVDFTNGEHRQKAEGMIILELQNVLNDSQNTFDDLEKLLVSVFKQMVPFLKTILDYKAFEFFVDLKYSFDYIEKCCQENIERPFPNVVRFLDLCYNTAYVFDDSDLDSCPEALKESVSSLINMFYKEKESKDSKSRIISEYGYIIFEKYYYFLNCFMYEDKNREKIVRDCRDWIPEICFDILWQIDTELNSPINDSYFQKAIKCICACTKT